MISYPQCLPQFYVVAQNKSYIPADCLSSWNFVNNRTWTLTRTQHTNENGYRLTEVVNFYKFHCRSFVYIFSFSIFSIVDPFSSHRVYGNTYPERTPKNHPSNAKTEQIPRGRASMFHSFPSFLFFYSYTSLIIGTKMERIIFSTARVQSRDRIFFLCR